MIRRAFCWWGMCRASSSWVFVAEGFVRSAFRPITVAQIALHFQKGGAGPEALPSLQRGVVVSCDADIWG